MEDEIRTVISKKFQALRANADLVFDSGSLKYSFDRLGNFIEKFTPFINGLENEIKSLPKDSVTSIEIESWVETLTLKIEKAKRNKDLSEIGSLFLTHRKKLKVKLLEIGASLSAPTDVKQEKKEELISTSLYFKDIFTSTNWRNYIDVLHQVDNPLITPDYTFIGKSVKHKGVIASWIKELQNKGKISKKFNRRQLAEVLNHEIKDFNLGKDGKTIDNYSVAYENEYKTSLKRLVDLLP